MPVHTSHTPHNKRADPSVSARAERARFIVLLLTIALLFSMVAIVGYGYLSEVIRAETHRTLTVIVEQKRQRVEDTINDLRVDAELHLSAHSQLERLLEQWLNSGRHDAALIKHMQSGMKEVGRVRGWSGVTVTDSRGRLIFSTDDAEIQPHAALVQDIIQRPRIELVDLHLNSKGIAQYGVLAPIGPAGQKPLGVGYITGRADRSVYPQVETWPVPTQTAETYLVRREDKTVRFLSPLRHRPDAALTLKRPLNMPHLPAAMAAQGKHGILSGGRDYRDAPVLAYAAPVTGTSWLMVAEIDEAEAYAGIHTLAWAVAVITCIGLLLLYATGYQSWRREREQKELLALRAIQAAEARFRVVFEQAPLGLVLFDAGLPRIAEANQRFADIVGRPLSRLIGLDPHQITHPDDIHSSGEMAAALNAGELADYHQIKRYLRPDGSVVWISETCAPLHVSPDEAPRRIAIIEDITERKEMEERLQISESRHRLLADNAIDVISTLDVNGRFSYVSPSVFATRGYTPDEVKQQALRDALSPASAAVIYEYFTDLKACIEEGRSLKSFRGELEYKCKDGSMIWCDATASPLLDSDGNFIEVLGVTRDISERRRYEDELRHVYDAAEAANAAKSEFLAHMSHEIRTPMNAVLGLAQVLERETLAPNQRDMVLRIRGAGQSLLTILNDVLDLSKIEAGQLRIEPRAFDLHSLLAKLDSLMGQTAHSKGVSLRIAPLPAGLGALLGDGLRLEQVLFNLTSNAIKFTEQGEVAITVTVCSSDADGLRLRFEVRDTGIGIASDGLAQLFTPFTQADAGISRRYGGTGLGLSICKRLLDLMGGVIGANSQPGLGSTFWFELPFDHAETHSQMPSGTATEPALPLGPRLNGAHILVVDDSAMNRDLVERALQIEGATSTLAADGQQAIQLLKNRPDAFAAVLMDVQMPVMDGLSATRMIRDELGLKDLPIIAFTAGVGVEQQAAARLAGADDILAKPMDLDQMALLLQQWITPPAAEVEVGAEAAKQGKSTAPSVTHASETSSQRAATARGDETFPAIVGIDHERVMRRLGGDREMFVSLVQMFFEDNSQAVSLTRQELAAGDTEAASRRMHTLASNAGFICAMEIMESARQLEQAIDRGDETEIALVVLEQLIANLLSASTEIRNLAA